MYTFRIGHDIHKWHSVNISSYYQPYCLEAIGKPLEVVEIDVSESANCMTQTKNLMKKSTNNRTKRSFKVRCRKVFKGPLPKSVLRSAAEKCFQANCLKTLQVYCFHKGHQEKKSCWKRNRSGTEVG